MINKIYYYAQRASISILYVFSFFCLGYLLVHEMSSTIYAMTPGDQPPVSPADNTSVSSGSSSTLGTVAVGSFNGMIGLSAAVSATPGIIKMLNNSGITSARTNPRVAVGLAFTGLALGVASSVFKR